MKKLLILTLSVSSLALFSFFQQQPGIKKIDTNLWEISKGAKFSVADKGSMQAMIKKEYGIKDFKTVQSLEYKLLAKGRWWIVNKHIGPDWITEKVITGKDMIKGLSNSAPELMKLLNRYSSNVNKKNDSIE